MRITERGYFVLTILGVIILITFALNFPAIIAGTYNLFF